MDDATWKKLKLSLERPYKDDYGQPIPQLLDLTPEGQHIYEPQEDWATKLGEKFRRIFIERGSDFFERPSGDSGARLILLADEAKDPDEQSSSEQGDSTIEEAAHDCMTPEMLFKMRMEILPRLHIALGEMSHARDLLSLLLASTTPNEPSSLPALPATSLSSTIVSKLPAIPSVQAFEAQLTTGGKDDALRKASNVLKFAAESMERGSSRSEKYWSDALKIRRGNWGLIPAPLPLGSATGKGADKTAKDFLISFGLEESPPIMRRRAIGYMSNTTLGNDGPAVDFPLRQKTRLRVVLKRVEEKGKLTTYSQKFRSSDGPTLDSAIRGAQQEVVDQEIFAELIKEAGNLPTAAARVSERSIAIEAAQGVDLRFELIDNDYENANNSESSGSAICDLIYWLLHVLLLRAHTHRKESRLGTTGVMKSAGTIRPTGSYPLLQPIVDLLQYQVFCDRVKHELSQLMKALRNAGVTSTLRFDPIGESGEQLAKSLVDDVKGKAGGEAVLRVDDRQSIAFTFMAPSTLVAHLPQATMPIASIPQLCQLLIDEVERCLLGRICDIGTEICEVFNGVWFVDQMMCRSVGRWEGCVLHFRVLCSENFTVDSTARRLMHSGESNNMVLHYSTRGDQAMGLFDWVKQIIEDTLAL